MQRLVIEKHRSDYEPQFTHGGPIKSAEHVFIWGANSGQYISARKDERDLARRSKVEESKDDGDKSARVEEKETSLVVRGRSKFYETGGLNVSCPDEREEFVIFREGFVLKSYSDGRLAVDDLEDERAKNRLICPGDTVTLRHEASGKYLFIHPVHGSPSLADNTSGTNEGCNFVLEEWAPLEHVHDLAWRAQMVLVRYYVGQLLRVLEECQETVHYNSLTRLHKHGPQCVLDRLFILCPPA